MKDRSRRLRRLRALELRIRELYPQILEIRRKHARKGTNRRTRHRLEVLQKRLEAFRRSVARSMPKDGSQPGKRLSGVQGSLRAHKADFEEELTRTRKASSMEE